MLVGYIRVLSIDDRQSVSMQKGALVTSGVDERHLHQDKASGAREDRQSPKGCLAGLRPRDTLVVWKFDRLGRSLPNQPDSAPPIRTIEP